MTIKEKFVKMCSLIYKYDDDLFKYPYETVFYSEEYNYLTENKDEYDFLLSKMDNLLKLVNNDNIYLNMDIEDELWHLI